MIKSEIELRKELVSKFFAWLLEARITFFFIVLNLLMFVVSLFFDFSDYVFRASDVFKFNFVNMVVSWFLHVNFAHLISNLLVLLVFGRIVERHFGAFKWLLIYFGAALVSDIFSAFFGYGGVGASGAISGLVSAALLLEPFYITHLFIVPVPVILIGWSFIYADVIGVFNIMQVNHFAHLGGYLSISLLVFLFNREERSRMLRGFVINFLFVAFLFVFMEFL